MTVVPSPPRIFPAGFSPALVLVALAVLPWFLTSGFSQQDSSTASESQSTVKVGAGSYSLERPKSCKPLPEIIYKSQQIKGAVPTNQWWSSLLWEKHSQNIFAHPLGMVCFEGGLSIAYPGAAIVAASGNIMGGGISRNGDLVIGLQGQTKFPSAVLADYSQWFVTAEFKEGNDLLRTTIGHGSPFVFCRHQGSSPEIQFAHRPNFWFREKGIATIGVTIRGNHYGIFGPAGATWNETENKIQLDSKKDYFSVALLPDNKKATLTAFQKCAHRHVIDSTTVFKIADGKLTTSYQIKTEPLESEAGATMLALYPHQWKYSSSPLTGQAYKSVRGSMKLIHANGFQTTVPIQGVLPYLPEEGLGDRTRLLAYLKSELPTSSDKRDFADSYWEGKRLGRWASLAGIAEAMGEEEIRAKFLNEIRVRLENWFTATANEDAPLFYYQKEWGTLIGSRPSYGSDDQLNDHHFHYGYFIRAAAELARFDSQWAKKWAPFVNLIIRDVASTQANDPLFPPLRCFDIYAGHSWASGHAKFGDGNNQESSSESLNAWYGMMLWGEVTGNQSVRDTGAFLFNTERIAVEEYWFDAHGTTFPKDFPNLAIGMVWGGKGAFATWFSGDIDHIHGINWLPFTPASVYLGRVPAYVEKNYQRVVRDRKAGTDFGKGWGDLVVMFSALSNPERAAKYLAENPKFNVEGGNSRSFMYHWIHTLKKLGLNDSKVSADHLFANVFQKNGRKTYAVYNFGKQSISVTFSDGKVVTAKPGGMTVIQ